MECPSKPPQRWPCRWRRQQRANEIAPAAPQKPNESQVETCLAASLSAPQRSMHEEKKRPVCERPAAEIRNRADDLFQDELLPQESSEGSCALLCGGCLASA